MTAVELTGEQRPTFEWAGAPRSSWITPEVTEIDFQQDITRAHAVVRQLIAKYRDFEPAWPMLRSMAEELLNCMIDERSAA